MENDKLEGIIRELHERAKELNCLYQVEELLNCSEAPLNELLTKIVEIIPCGWQFPEMCQAEIAYDGKIFSLPNLPPPVARQIVEIKVLDKTLGSISVAYTQPISSGASPFLREEEKLLRTIADRLGHTIAHKKLRKIFRDWDRSQEKLAEQQRTEWRRLMEMLRSADRNLFFYTSQKLLRYLSLNGIEPANQLLQRFNITHRVDHQQLFGESNRPSEKQKMTDILRLSEQVFEIAAENLDSSRILELIQKWIRQDKSRFLVQVVDNSNSELSEVIEAITRYRYQQSELELTPSSEKGLLVSLVRRFFSDHLSFINVAKNFVTVAAIFSTWCNTSSFPIKAMGVWGGKSAGLFVAEQILAKSAEDFLNNLQVPKTWYIASDGLMSFIRYNNLEDAIEQKYKELEEIQMEYPNLVQIFKNSHFPPEMLTGLSMAIDDLGDNPIIVRSSSLLEDRFGSAFSGKYKSFFLANRGSKQQKLEALTDAIAEVYASTFAPDPIEYRLERGLLDFHEEMGVMIQQVVGRKIGPYFFPVLFRSGF